MKAQKFFALVLFCLMLAGPLLAHAAANDILDQIPDDATGVLMVRSMSTASRVVRGDLVQMGVPLPENMFDQFLANMGLNHGVREDGSLALVAINMPAPKDGQKLIARPYVLLLPASDPTAMLANLHPTAPQQGISMVTLPNQTESGYVAIVGGYVAAAQDPAVLSTFLAHKGSLHQLPPAMCTVFDGSDVVLYVNVPAYSAKLSAHVDQFHAAIKGLALLNPTMTKEQIALKMNKLQLLCDGLKLYLNDTKATMFSIRFNEQGVRLGVTSFFKPDTTLAIAAAAQKGLPPVNFDMLPAGEYLAAGAGSWDGATTGDLLDKVFNQLMGDADLATLVPQLKKMADYDKQIMTQALRARFVLFSPPQNDLKKLSACMIVDSNDPEKLQNLLSDAFGQPVIQSCPDIATTITVEKNEEGIKGVTLTKITIKVTPQPPTPDHPRSAAMKKNIQMLLNAQGPKGFTIFTGVTQKKLIILMGQDRKALEPSIVAVQTVNSSVLSKQLQDVMRGESPMLSGATSALYLPVERWIKLAQETAPPTTASAAAGPAAQTPGNVFLPLIFSKAAGENSARVQWTIPQALLIDLGQLCVTKFNGPTQKQDGGK